VWFRPKEFKGGRGGDDIGAKDGVALTARQPSGDANAAPLPGAQANPLQKEEGMPAV